MSLWAASKLDEKGELIWIRDVWNDSINMIAWMQLAMYQRHGIEWSEDQE